MHIRLARAFCLSCTFSLLVGTCASSVAEEQVKPPASTSDAAAKAETKETPAATGSSQSGDKTDAGTTGNTGDTTGSTEAPEADDGAVAKTGSLLNPDATTPTLGTSTLNAGTHKPINTNREALALILPTHLNLQRYLRLSQPEANARLESIRKRSYAKLKAVGVDPTLDLDQAVASGNLALSIYVKRSVGSNLMSKGFMMEAFLIRYTRKGTGPMVATQFQKVGETPEIYSIGDAEDQAVMLVDAFISQRKHRLDSLKFKTKGASKSAPAKGKHK